MWYQAFPVFILGDLIIGELAPAQVGPRDTEWPKE